MSKYAHNVVSEAEQNTPWFKIMGWIGDKPKVLDVGCSSGYFGEKLIEARHATVWGVDLDKDDAAAAKKRGYQDVLVGDLDAFDWKRLGSKKFDAIIFADVLEHVKDPLANVSAASKLLAAGGYIYTSIPNIAHITVRTELMEGNFDYESTGLLDNTHIRFFTKKTVQKLFYDAGLEVVHFDSTTNDVSNGQVRDHMKRMGLNPSSKFDEILYSQEARTFQYIVGARIPNKGFTLIPPKLLKQSSKLHDDWPAIEKTLQQNDETIKRLQQENALLHNELDILQTRIREIKRNPAKWVAKKVYHRVKRRRG